MNGITYDWDDDFLVKEGLTCPDCGGTHTYFDYFSRFWHCEDCSYAWDVERRNLSPVQDPEGNCAISPACLPAE